MYVKKKKRIYIVKFPLVFETPAPEKVPWNKIEAIH